MVQPALAMDLMLVMAVIKSSGCVPRMEVACLRRMSSAVATLSCFLAMVAAAKWMLDSCPERSVQHIKNAFVRLEQNNYNGSNIKFKF